MLIEQWRETVEWYPASLKAVYAPYTVGARRFDFIFELLAKGHEQHFIGVLKSHVTGWGHSKKNNENVLHLMCKFDPPLPPSQSLSNIYGCHYNHISQMVAYTPTIIIVIENQDRELFSSVFRLIIFFLHKSKEKTQKIAKNSHTNRILNERLSRTNAVSLRIVWHSFCSLLFFFRVLLFYAHSFR